jgi:hypothetical protein
MTTRASHIRKVIDDLIHLILGLEIATRTAMAALPATRTPHALLAPQLLGLRTRLRSPLRT